jgi:hypothetical protein
MKKFDFKAGLYFGILMTIFYIVQNLWKAEVLSTRIIEKFVVVGLISGAIAGLIFALFIGIFKASKFVNKTTIIETLPDENIVFQTPANHFKGAESVGGRLYLTTKRLVFKSHKLNIQNHELSINLTEIANINRYNVLGVIKNGLKVSLKNNQIEKFVVEQADEWIKKMS